MKKIFLSLLCAVCVWAVNAQTTYLRISQLDGYTIKVPVGHIDSIDFVTTDEEPTTPEEPSTPNFNGHEYVDLGLPSGTLWATCNVGANSPELFGYYFAWGEISPKDDYSWETYVYSADGTRKNLTKYIGADGLTKLDLKDDAARVNWGGTWRMPTTQEQQELINNCDWEWTNNYNYTNISGYVVKSQIDNTKYIFLPASGQREAKNLLDSGSGLWYWSASVYVNSYINAWCINAYHYTSIDKRHINRDRCEGMAIRPVCSPAK